MSRCVPKDSRINFVLNSGSISCLRAIPVFQESKLDEQLTRASVAFLRKNLVVDISTCTIILPAILSWYKNDFAQEDEKRVTKRDCAMYIARLLLRGGRMESVGASKKFRFHIPIRAASRGRLCIGSGFRAS